jgi:glycosyltransferase involved in cell wall biosynthesis
MKIGVLAWLNKENGGTYQYSLTAIRALMTGGGKDDSFVLFTDAHDDPEVRLVRGHGWEVRPIEPPRPSRVRSIAARSARRVARVGGRVLDHSGESGPGAHEADYAIMSRPRLDRWFRSAHVELMVYPVTDPASFETELPYVIAVHDVQHRLQPQFPELSANGEWAWREYLFRNATRKATLVMVDSDVGKEDVLASYGEYGVEPDRVKVLPFAAPPYIGSIALRGADLELFRERHGLPDRYLFYPAQFWPHKNHIGIVRALGVLRRNHGLDVAIVFCGSHQGEIREQAFADVVAAAREEGVEGQVCHLGYVADEEMASLYSCAEALVMPTFLGPTNIPILEAWSLACPALTSDIRGVREQAGDAAVLVDPESVEALAEGMRRLWCDESLRADLVERGRRRLAEYTFEHFRDRFLLIIEEAKERVRDGRVPRLSAPVAPDVVSGREATA